MISTIDGYADILWTDVVANIEAMTEQVSGFQAACRKLPKALRDWDAYADLRKKIDDFLVFLPLVQALASPSMRPRHWRALMDLAGVELDMAEDTFKLQHLIDANLLPKQEEIEELTGGANKEAQVETKLEQIERDWEDQNFTFNVFKTKGESCSTPAPRVSWWRSWRIRRWRSGRWPRIDTPRRSRNPSRVDRQAVHRR